MKKLMWILVLLLGSLSFVACGKKKDEGNSCQGYPAGYVAVTDHRMLQMLNGSGGYNGNYGNGNSYGNSYGNGYGNNYNSYINNNYGNNNYGNYGQNNNNQQYNQPHNGQNYNQQNNGVTCVDQYTFQQLQQQANGGVVNGGGNIYGGGTNCQMYPTAQGCGGGGGSFGSGDPYCDYFPYDPICRRMY